MNVQRMLGARNLNHARWGAMFAALLKLTPAFIFALPGVIALVLYPNLEQPRKAFVAILNNLLPTGVRGYVLAALVGAIISALIAVMNSVSTMAVRDFILHFRPHTSERAQIYLGRVAIVVSQPSAWRPPMWSTYNPEASTSICKRCRFILVMPIAPAIIFGILSKRVTFAGAAASVAVGVALAGIFVADALSKPEIAAAWFPWLHHPLTFNFTYRGGWGTLVITIVLFLVSAFTTKTDPVKLAKTTIHWGQRPEPFRGLSDWRLHLVVLLAVTVAIYWRLW